MHVKFTGFLMLGAIALAGCQENAAPTADSNTAVPTDFAKSRTPLTGTPAERAAQIAASVNARLEAAGSTKRLDDAYFFTVGHGTPDFRRLRTGSRWVNPRTVTFAIDQKPEEIVKRTSDRENSYLFNDAEVIQAVRNAFNRYNGVDNIVLHVSEKAGYTGIGRNDDILDAIVRNADGACVDIVDDVPDNDAINDYDPATGNIDFTPIADNLFGGWLAPEYFEDCLGSADIIGVTWSFSDVDGALGDGKDGYPDRVYTEMYYNTLFNWNVRGSIYLDDPFDGGEFDVESIVTHEAGHTNGLGHFGGPNDNQPFKLHPNGRVFDPEAVMNPFYLGGEKRELLPTDIAALRALYASKKLQ
jgi:hypothetical protein